MLAGQPLILISYSERFRSTVAQPVADRLAAYGVRAVLVGEEPMPAGLDSHPDAKVTYFFDLADMVVFLATPDDRVESGELHTRQNIVDELRRGLERQHLKHKLLVFKADDVVLPSNVNPVYEPLPLDEPEWIAERVVRQAREWGLLPREPADAGPAPLPQSSNDQALTSGTVGHTDQGAEEQAAAAVNEV